MSQANSNSINQRHVNGTAVGVNNGSVNVTYKIRHIVNNINFGLQYIQYSIQHSPAELAEKEHQRVIQAWNNFKLCGLLLEIKEFQAWFNMQCQRSVLWISGCPKHGTTTLMSYMIEYIREKRIMRPFKSCHLLYYYVDKTVTGSSYRNLQQTFWQQADSVDGVQMHVFNNQGNEDSRILDELVKRLAAAQRDVYIIIDGLDQLPRRHSYELLSRLCNLSEKLKGENTCGGGHLAVAISSQNTPSLDRGKGYDRVFDLRLGPDYISSDIRKYLGNSSSDSTIFMGTTDLRRHSIQAQLDKGTNNYPCLSSSIFYNPQGATTTQRLQTGISVLLHVLDVSIGLEDHGDVCGHVHDVYAHGCEGSIWTDAAQRARRLEEALDFLQVRDEVDAGIHLDDVPAGDHVSYGGLRGSGETVFGHDMSGEDELGRAPSWSLS